MKTSLNQEDLSCYYIKEPACKKSFECACVNKMLNRMKRQIEGTITPREAKTLQKKQNGGIIFDGACKSADQIIGIDIPYMNELCDTLNNSPDYIIKENMPTLKNLIQAFLSNQGAQGNEIFLTSTDSTRNKNMNRLEITFKRGIKTEDKEKIMERYTNK